MRAGPIHRLTGAALAVAMLAAVLVASAEYLNLRAGADEPFAHLDKLALRQPWGGLAAQESIHQIGGRWRHNPPAALEAMDWHLARYPLDAQAWLNRTRIQGFLGAERDSLRRDLATARAVYPASRDVGWQAVNLAQGFAEAELIGEQLRYWLEGQPNAVSRALFLAARWIPEPAERVARILPEGEDYRIAAMRYARVNMLPSLAEAIWQELPQPRPDGDPALADYLRTLMSGGDNASVVRLRQGLDETYRHGDLPGGHFSGNLAWLDAMGWELRAPASVSVTLEPLHGDSLPALMREARLAQALVIGFDGSDNVNLRAPWVRFTAPAPGRWRLEGWWQAEQLSTRSLPALHLRALEGGQRKIAALPAASFRWQPFALEIELEQPDEPLELRLVRQSTRAFDRDIAGILRLAGLRFLPLAEDQGTSEEEAQP